MGGDVRKPWVHVLSRDLCENNCRVCVVASKHIIVVFPSYLALLMLEYGDRMEKGWVTCHWAEEEGLSFREAERVIESKLFLNKYPQWGLGTPHQLVILHEMFLHAAGWGRKRQNICATKAIKAAYWNLIPRWVKLPWSWWGTKHLGRK